MSIKSRIIHWWKNPPERRMLPPLPDGALQPAYLDLLTTGSPYLPVIGWAHLKWIEPTAHVAFPVEGSFYLQPGTRNLEAKCSGCTEAIIALTKNPND